eukprot:5795743-Amphidinium_carterae.1
MYNPCTRPSRDSRQRNARQNEAELDQEPPAGYDDPEAAQNEQENWYLCDPATRERPRVKERKEDARGSPKTK